MATLMSTARMESRSTMPALSPLVYTRPPSPASLTAGGQHRGTGFEGSRFRVPSSAYPRNEEGGQPHLAPPSAAGTQQVRRLTLPRW